jgi:hypothetical protein
LLACAREPNSAQKIIGAGRAWAVELSKIVIANPIGVRSLQIAIDGVEENLKLAKKLTYSRVSLAYQVLYRISPCNTDALHAPEAAQGLVGAKFWPDGFDMHFH